MQKIQLQTPEGIREYLFIPGTAEYDAARETGEIHVGDDIVYRNCLVEIIDGFAMLVLEMIQGMPMYNPVMPDMDSFAGRAPDMGSWQQAPGGMQWSFTVNGQPVSPDQFNAAMGGGIPRQ